ncbi:uncharacterized protein LOC132034329 isoform X1 [Lycium ferocissimum]|uniref:uncharacterized protein LOC132034329 isoform X1 n=1 Tax=Lycium ferocissimum TaxID=112874 RepID=UPI002815E7D0|nr:uncharacterized protein LOC132034329 isoform X1 [Lycium ferocissimum]
MKMVKLMVKAKEQTRCTSARLLLWNEELTRNQVSESEGLCVIIIRRKYMRLNPCECGSSDCDTLEDSCCSTVIPFELSRLLNKDSSLFRMLLAATLQFPSKNILQLTKSISTCLFTQFEFSQPPPPPPRPTYVIALEISHNLFIDYTSHAFVKLSALPWRPPVIPLFCRFEKEWDEEEELRTCARSLSTTDFMNDPYHGYYGVVLQCLYALREYTGEAGICPTKPPIAADVPKGLVELRAAPTLLHYQHNEDSRDLMDETCPVCYQDFKEKSQVITTNCLHEFHTKCLLSWLSKKNTCPTCRAVYPLHYSPSSSCRKRPDHNILEASI